MTVLILDTSLHVAQAALFENDNLTAHVIKQGDKGQTDMLLPALREAMQKWTWQDLNFVGVTVGPGVFTGIRAGVAAARALHLALEVEMAGISTLDAISHQTGAELVVIDAHKNEAYVKYGADAPQLLSCTLLAPLLDKATSIAAYPSAFARTLPSQMTHKIIGVDRLDPAAMLHAARHTPLPAMPLYIRAPDALPQTGKAFSRA